MARTISTVEIIYDDDMVTARQRARQVARLLAFEEQDQTRLSTAVSEIARIIVNHKMRGCVDFSLEGETAPQVLLVSISGSGPMAEREHATQPTGDASFMGWEAALISARRLMDQCEMRQVPEKGTTIWLKKILPKRAPLWIGKSLERLVKQIDKHEPQNPMEEVRQQNQDLLRALEELHERQQELSRLNGELEDTNRGVVALYAELDEKADHLRRADEMKSRFLSNMSHEFRTPLNAILALSQLLLDRADGELTSEQEKQVNYIKRSGSDLLELVNDLLDIAKIEAGKVVVKPGDLEVTTLFSALRGMLRPLLLSRSVNLVFEEPDSLPTMWTDEGKVSQILRNFISNAIKFTEEGEVRVSAQLVDDGHAITFSVSDTGVGIALPDQRRIFEEFSQIDNPIQGKVKGTGLGLPLCRKLAELLGGTIGVTSSLGEGSTFHVTLPVAYVPADHELLKMPEVPETQPEAGRVPILVVEDEAETRLLYEKYLRNSPFQPIPAGSIRQARETLRRHRVAAIILDVLLPDEAAWQWLSELKGQEATRHVPVLVATSVEDPRKALALGADDYCLKPIQRAWLLERLKRVTGTADEGVKRTAPLVLIIDDQEADRYILRRHISVIDCSIAESATGEAGLKLARDLKPALILLDLNMPGMDGFSVLEQLHENPATATIPVVIVTSQMLMPGRETVLAYASAVLKKDELSPRSLQQALIEAGFASVGVAEGSNVGNSD